MQAVSVIIPTFNRCESLNKTLLSFYGQTFKDFEIIVVDDGGGDGTEAMVESLSPPYALRYLRQEHAGISSARNLGIENANCKIILFVDDHIIVDPKLIEEHIKFHEKYNVKVVRGRVEFLESPKETKYVPEEKIRPPFYEQDPFRSFITNNISVEKEALKSVYGFDEDFKEYGLRDSELGYRMRMAGYRFKFNPNAVGYIFSTGLTFEDRCKRRREVGRSSVLFYKKHPTFQIKLILSTHSLSRFIYKLISRPLFVKAAQASKNLSISQKFLFFYNFLAGINEGFEKYKDKRFSVLHSRFKKKYNILLVSHQGDLSGAPISLYLLAKNLNKDLFNVIFSVPEEGPIIEKLKEAGIETVLLKEYGLIPFSAIKKIIKDKRIDLVHANTVVSSSAAWAGRLLNVPVIWHIREDLRDSTNWLKRKEIELLADRIILISDWMKGFIKSKKAVTVHNAVDIEEFSKEERVSKIREEYGIKEGEKLVGIIGSLEARKGVDLLIKAASLVARGLRDVKYLIVGEPLPRRENYKTYLKNLASKLGVEKNIIFTGRRADIPEVISSIDLLIVPSIVEPFGRVAIEAMAGSRAVIGTDFAGLKEIIVDGVTGKLIPPQDYIGLASAITFLLKNKNLRETMGTAGRDRAIRLFNIKKHVEAIEKIYKELLF